MTVQTNPALRNFIHQFRESYGFCPLGVYCIATGKQIGIMNPDEVESLIGEWSGDDMVIDDVATRLLASMRPSIQWNKMREETLDEMRVRAPVDTLAYLLNRLIAPEEFRTQSLERRLSNHSDRIKLHQFLATLDEESRTKMLHMLIEVDAKCGLDSLPQPFAAVQFIDSDARLEMVATFYREQCALYDARVKADEQMNRWVKYGNPLARQAFGRVWMETKPDTKVEVAKKEKRKEMRFFENLFDEITGAKSHTESDVEVVKPEKVAMPKMRLGKLNLAKKG